MSAPKKKTVKRKAAAPKKARAPAKKRATARKPSPNKAATKAARKPKRKASSAASRNAGGRTEPEQQSLLPPDPKLAQLLDERLLVPQRVAAMAFDITVEALKKWKVKAHSKRGRETLYNISELISYRMERVDANEHDLIASRARLAKAQAFESELRAEQLKGNLIPADILLENWEPLVGAARQKVLAIPAKLKSQIPHLTDDDLKLITEICRGTLEDLANGGIPKRARSVTRAAL